MPAWPGGPCPACGEEMPAKLIHCQSCRALLNPELESDSVEVPVFIPLREVAAMIDVPHNGYYIGCPICDRELRINKKYTGKTVQCKHCTGQFPFDVSSGKIRVSAYYSSCPHCGEELRAAPKYVGERVACKHCNGQIRLMVEDLSAK